MEVGEWAQQREEKLGSAGRCGPLAQSGRVGPSSSHDQGARASGRGISVPGTVFAQIEGQQARSDAVTSHLCEPEPALPPPWATVLSSAHAADQMQLLLVRPVRSSTTQSGQTNIGCRGPRGAALRGRDAGPEHGTSADGTATHTAAAPPAPRGRCPPRPAAAPSPAPRRPAACQAFRGDHSPGRPRRTGAGLGAEGMRVPTGTGLGGEQRGADERGAGTSWGGGAGGGAPGSPPPHFLPGGLEPEGRRLAGDSASLCRRPRLLGTAAAAPIPAAGPAVLLETETSLTTHE